MRRVGRWMLLTGYVGLLLASLGFRMADCGLQIVDCGGNTSQSTVRNLQPATDAIGFLVKFGLVLLLLYGSLRVLRGVTLRWRGFAPSTAQIAVLETRYLSPRRALYLVRAGSRVLLLGGTDQQISLLADVTDELFEDAETDEAMAPLRHGNATFRVPLEGGSRRS